MAIRLSSSLAALVCNGLVKEGMQKYVTGRRNARERAG